MSSSRGRAGNSHTDRVILVQQTLAEMGPGKHQLSEITARTKLDDSTVGRILARLVYLGLAVRPERGRYAPGIGTAEIGLHPLANKQLSDDRRVKQILDTLRLKTDLGLVFLYTKTQLFPSRNCLAMSVGDSGLDELGMSARDVLMVNRSLRTGASGRTILAYLSSEVQETVLQEQLPDEAGPGAITDVAELRASLAEVRDQGFALGYQECMARWNSVAAPIVWEDSIVGAVLLLKPFDVMPHAPEEYIEATVEAAAQLSLEISGWY
ncbi:IclR family transcriptional regulator [Streptomyces prunicolor]|uniref:IclR family transcriptional regulator n=1 Tax=Streptomyces prunicolor TaxID=67348 RepID=UPI00037EF509|nr:IclR family transcriptional regulator C-terminal domain-containing protein [Streptomyces prunicolor]